jgi:hypothetical protein
MFSPPSLRRDTARGLKYIVKRHIYNAIIIRRIMQQSFFGARVSGRSAARIKKAARISFLKPWLPLVEARGVGHMSASRSSTLALHFKIR